MPRCDARAAVRRSDGSPRPQDRLSFVFVAALVTFVAAFAFVFVAALVAFAAFAFVFVAAFVAFVAAFVAFVAAFAFGVVFVAAFGVVFVAAFAFAGGGSLPAS